MQHKNIEELEKEFDEKFPEPIWIIADVGGDTDEIDLREQLKSLLLSAYNLGVEKSIEGAKGEILDDVSYDCNLARLSSIRDARY